MTEMQYRLNISYKMSNTNPRSKRPVISTFSTRIGIIAAEAWIDADDSAARAATPVGVLVTKTNALTNGVPLKWGVVGEEVDIAAGDAPDFTYPFDKFAASLLAGGNNGQITIPGRKDSAVTLESDGVSVSLTGAAVAAWVTAFEAVALSEDLLAETVERMFVTS
jgi:hypothetical protein